MRSLSRSPFQEGFADNRKIENVIIAKNLDEVPHQVQIQALELMRTKRIFTHTSVQIAPKRFLFIALLAGGEGPRLTKNLNDYIFISHFHDPEDGFPNMEDLQNDVDSISSVVKKKAIGNQTAPSAEPLISASDIETLAQKSAAVIITVEMKAYLQNIVTFLRLHHAVAGGITAVATKHFDKLVKHLAPLHGLHYVTPSLVALAAKKIYLHRIPIVAAENERSMQWGSNLDAVEAALEEVGPEECVDDVLDAVEVPL